VQAVRLARARVIGTALLRHLLANALFIQETVDAFATGKAASNFKVLKASAVILEDPAHFLTFRLTNAVVAGAVGLSA